MWSLMRIHLYELTVYNMKLRGEGMKNEMLKIWEN